MSGAGDPGRAPLPQQATRTSAVVDSVEWFFEPCWRGDRLMLRVADGRLSITDDGGEPADEAYGELIEVAERALRVTDALIDGIWTSMPFVGEGSPARNLASAIADEGLTDELPDPIENEMRRALIAVDLVEVDRQPLHDVPYQERRRLLGSVFDESVQVRITPAVRAPVDSWLVAWRAGGFTDYLAKHMNSRYLPGETAPDWLQIPTQPRRGRNALGRLFPFGGRGQRAVRIVDSIPEERQSRP